MGRYSGGALMKSGGAVKGNIILDNNIAIKVKETNGTERKIVYIDGSNYIKFGNTARRTYLNNGTVYIYSNVLKGLSAPSAATDAARLQDTISGKAASDVTGSRALDTIYQNTSGFQKLVLVYLKIDATAAGGQAEGHVHVDIATPPLIEMGKVQATLAATTDDVIVCLAFVVADDAYYKIITSTSNGTIAINRWIEI